MPEDLSSPEPIKFAQGIDNRSREYAVPGDALRVCENLDVTRDGGLLSRKGLREVTTGDFHSPFVHPSQRFMLIVKDDFLQRVAVNEELTVLVAVAGPVCYGVLNDVIYWSDGQQVGRVLLDGTLSFWGMASPPIPLVSAVPYGGLFAGTYQVAMTAIHTTGVESGCRETVEVEVTEGGGIQVTTPASSSATFAIYRSTVQGGKSELRRALIAPPATVVDIGHQNLGNMLESLHAIQSPPGRRMVAHKGRLWVAAGNVVWFTSDRSPHWVFPRYGFYQYESSVTMLGAAEDGIYVGLTNRIYFLQGNDPYDMRQRPVSSIGAASGNSKEIPYDIFLGDDSFPSRQCAFYDADGYLSIGKPGGIIIRPTRDRFSAGALTDAELVYSEREGVRQIVSVTAGVIGTRVAKDVPISEEFSNGVVLNT